jgi:uncharacterized secreted repeat protein (TIGR03808 family)
MTINRRQVMPAGLALAGGLGMGAGTTFAKDLKPNSKSDQSQALADAITAAKKGSGVLRLPAGRFILSAVQISEPVVIAGSDGRTLLISTDGAPIFSIMGAGRVVLEGLGLETEAKQDENERIGLIVAEATDELIMSNCSFTGGAKGVVLESCGGRISGCSFAGHSATGVFANDSRGLEITGNRVEACGNNGIQVWTSEPREDGTIISNNRIARIAANGGGSGQNGNGINVFRAGNVTISNNRITDCAFSAIRNNGGANCAISGNSISRTGEVAIYVEFGFQGAVVSNNMIEDVGFGISVTNFNEGGRLAVVSGNVVRNCKGGTTEGVKTGGGIAAEADTNISGNTIENAKDVGLSLGWGPYCRDLTATGNLIRECGVGIKVSMAEGARPVLIANNMISGSREAAVLGMDHEKPVTGDLAAPGAEVPERVKLSGNLVS